MSSTKLTGQIKVIKDRHQVNEKFVKREFVIKVADGMYPQDILLQLIQDGCSLIDQFKEGQMVDVNINIRGREWVDPKTGEIKYFNTLQAWSIYAAGAQANTAAPAQAPAPAPEAADDDDLPF